jgi:Kef-type K+ transport system membrane component KefB
MNNLAWPIATIDYEETLHRLRGEYLSAVIDKVNLTVKGSAGEPLLNRLGASEQIVSPLEYSTEVVEGVKPLWEIWRTDPANNILLALAIIIIAAKIGEELARRVGLPAVLGELLMGILLGNIYLFSGWPFFNFLKTMSFLKIVGDFGAIILLFSVGLHTDLRAFLRVGLSAFLIAFAGVITPAGLGYLACRLLLPEAPAYTHFFMAVTLCATSIGITVRVFDELGKLDTLEARLVIGAAIIDDILALFAVGIMSGLVLTGQFAVEGVLITVGLAILFLSSILVPTLKYGRRFGNFATEKFPESLKVFVVVVVCLLFAFLAESIGLATIVGAFAAGLFLRDIRLKGLEGRERSVDAFVRPSYWIFVPFFFVLIGSQVRLESFLDKTALMVGGAIIAAGVSGKLVCGLCVVERV